MGGIDDHRNASRHRLDQPLLQALLDVDPGALHGCIAKDLDADRIGGEHQGRWFTGGGEQGRQGFGQGGLATGGRADQQMAAQRRRGGGRQGGPASGCLQSFAGESFTPGPRHRGGREPMSNPSLPNQPHPHGLMSKSNQRWLRRQQAGATASKGGPVFVSPEEDQFRMSLDRATQISLAPVLAMPGGGGASAYVLPRLASVSTSTGISQRLSPPGSSPTPRQQAWRSATYQMWLPKRLDSLVKSWQMNRAASIRTTYLSSNYALAA